MTKARRGSSLLQNPDADTHKHFHLHDRSPLDSSRRQKRQDSDSDSLITKVVQEVSLVHYVDADGVPISVQTLLSPPSTVLYDPASGSVVDASSPEPEPEAPSPSPAPAEILGPVVDPIVDPVLDALPDPILDLPLPEITDPLAIIPEGILPQESSTSTPSSAFPTLSGPFNHTGFWNSSLFTNSSALRPFRISTTISSSSSTDVGETITAVAAPPGYEGAGGAGGQAPVDTSAGGPSDPGPPPTGTIVGSVVGSMAGAALVVFLVLIALKWKRKQNNRVPLDDDDGPSEASNRGLITDGSDSGHQMAQRPLPFGVPDVLASLSGYRMRKNSDANESGHKGFERISGKKLPSVLEYGGDGYTDPRHSVMSGTSSHYRDSQNFDLVVQGGTTRLALGSPMRPVSGVPVMRDGPARTPTEHTNPFSDPPTPTSPWQPPDRIGRSLTSQDGSRGSGSRFTEEM